MRTLNCRRAKKELKPADGKYTEITMVKEHRGRKPSVSIELENKFKLFIIDYQRIGQPRCQQRCAEDMQAYFKYENIHIKSFVDEKPGK